MQWTVAHERRSPRVAVGPGLLTILLAISGCGGTSGGGSTGSTEGGVARAATWAKSYGGPAREQATAAAALADGGYIFAGIFNNRGVGGGRIFGLGGGGVEGDAWITALDSFGDIRWQRSYGLRAADPNEFATTYLVARPAFDGAGTWLAGRVATAPDSIYTERAFDLVITRLDAADQVRFSNSYDSGPFPFFPYFFTDEQQTSEAAGYLGTDLWPTSDGGVVVATSVQAFVLANNRGEVARAVWVLKLNAAGEREWSTFVGADEFIGFNGSDGYGFDHSHYRGNGPNFVQVRSEPGGGAVLTYGIETRDADEERAIRTKRMDVVRLDPGNQSIRWRVRFEDEDEPNDVLVVDADRNGVIDGVLVGGTTDVDDSFQGPEQGVVRLLDGPDGRELWRRDMGDIVVGLAEACGSATCEYAALVSEQADQSFVRMLDIGGGNTLAERQFSGEAARHIRSLPGLARFQVLTSSGFGETILRAMAAAPPLPIVSETRFATPMQVSLVAAAANGYLGLAGEFGETQRLFRLDAGGVGTLSAPINDPDDPRVESAYAIHTIRNTAGTQDIGFLAAAEMLSGIDPVQRAVLLLRLDLNGAIVWQERLDGFSFNYPQIDRAVFAGPVDLLAPAADGGYFLGGYALGWGRVVKIDANGAIQWSTPPLSPEAGWQLRAIRATPDGGVLVAGGQLGSDLARAWVARLDGNGAVQWQYRYDSPESFDPGFHTTDMRVTADGGALLAGLTMSGASAAVRINADGTVRRSRAYFTNPATDANSNVRVATTANGWALAATVARSRQGAVEASGRNNVLLFEIAGDNDARPASVRWGRLHGAQQDEVVHGLEALADGGFLISAQSDSMGDYTEAWMLRVGANGRIGEGCNADLGESIPTSAELPLVRTSYIPDASPEELRPAPITAVTTNVVAEQPADVVVARQCAGVANDNSPNVETFSLTVRQAGSLSGVVTSVPSGIVCGTGAGTAGCSASFATGSDAFLSVDPGSVSTFLRWEDCDEIVAAQSGAARCRVRMDRDRSVRAIFGQPRDRFQLRFTVNGTGTIRSGDDGIRCGVFFGSDQDCENFYDARLPGSNLPNSISLAVFTNADDFVGWGGDCAIGGTERGFNLTMDSDKNCTATFAGPPTSFDLTVQRTGTGSGEVVSAPPAISCGSLCVASFPANGTVRLRATPDAASNSTFGGWTGCDRLDQGPAGSIPVCEVDMNAARAVSAAFLPATPIPGPTQQLRTRITFNGRGSIASNPPGIVCSSATGNGASCIADFAEGSVVRLIPTPEPGFRFVEWRLDADCADGEVTMDATKSCEAVFEPSGGGGPTFTLSFIPGQFLGGHVETDDQAILCPGSSCSASYAPGTLVRLRAVPDAGRALEAWTGDCESFGLLTSVEFAINADFACGTVFVTAP